MRILLVDDKAENLYLLEKFLQGNGHATDAAANGVEALESALQNPPDVAVSDILMPVMDGFALCREWRKNVVLQNIPFVFYTATYTDPKDEEFALSLGADRFIVKPIDLNRLLEIIHEAYTAHRVQTSQPVQGVIPGERVFLKEYNEALVRKLEDKAAQTEAAEKELRQKNLALENDIEQRRRADRELRASEQRYQTLVNVSPVGVFRTDALGITTYVNARWCEISGLPAEEALGNGWLKAVHPSDRASLEAGWKNTALAETASHAEYRFLLSDGTVRWVMGQANPEKDDAGRVVGFVGTITDLTARKQAEEALQESEQRYRDIFRYASIGIYQSTAEGTFITANPRLAKILGYDSVSELMRRNLSSDVYWDAELCEALIAANEPGGSWENQEVRWKTKNGDPIWIELSSHAVNDNSRQGPFFEGFVKDVSKRKWAIEKLKQSEEQFRLISENVADLIAVLDLKGRRVYNSPSYNAILGDALHVPGSDSFQEIHPDDRERMKSIFEETVKTGCGQRAEFRLITRDGAVRQIESQGSVIRDSHGSVVNVVVVSRDVTDKRALEQQFLRAQRLESLGTLAGGVAHDLNNILTPILLSIALLRVAVSGKPETRILNSLETSAQRGADIVKQILAFARGIEGERTLLQPRHIVKEIISIAKETFPKDISVQGNVGKATWTIKADPTQLHQLLMNLCVNARDAMPHGGRLTIAVENRTIDEHHAGMHLQATPGRYLLLSVEDTGTGMPPEIVDHVFEPFFTTKEPGKGTGLGLSTVHTIVKGHDGFIDVSSQVGKGTCFNVYLPASGSLEVGAVADDQRRRFPGNGELILVVDDEISIALITKQSLEAFGYRVLTASDGAEAFALYVSQFRNIALVVTDMMMPIMGGQQLIHAIRRLNPSARIIASSGLITNVHTDGKKASADAFLGKPYTTEMLLEAIDSVLRKSA